MKGQSFKVSKTLLYTGVAVLALVLVFALIVPRASGLESCPLEGKVKLEYFYSESCPACDTQKPILRDLLEEFGDYVEFVPRCVYIHAGDDTTCIEMWGEESFLKAMDRATEIELRATPTIALECNDVEVGVKHAKDLKQWVCSHLSPSPAICG